MGQWARRWRRFSRMVRGFGLGSTLRYSLELMYVMLDADTPVRPFVAASAGLVRNRVEGYYKTFEKAFDSSVNAGRPYRFTLGARMVIPGWDLGLEGLKEICERLIAHGMDPDTPAALIEKGTTLNQRVHVRALATLPDVPGEQAVQPPTLTIVGSVVSLHATLDWFSPAEPFNPPPG